MKTSDFEIVSTDTENDQFNDLKLDFDPNLMVLSFRSSISFTQSYTQIYKLIGRRNSGESIMDDTAESAQKSNKEVSIIIFHRKMISVPPVRGLHAKQKVYGPETKRRRSVKYQGLRKYHYIRLIF